MGKPTDFNQFAGPGQAYAPKPPKAASKPAVPFTPAPVQAVSDEDKLRAVINTDPNTSYIRRRTQSTDHMN